MSSMHRPGHLESQTREGGLKGVAQEVTHGDVVLCWEDVCWEDACTIFKMFLLQTQL